MNSAEDQMPPVAKFVSPTVANGKVYVPASANLVAVYGLFPPSAISHRPGISRSHRAR